MCSGAGKRRELYMEFTDTETEFLRQNPVYTSYHSTNVNIKNTDT